MHLFFSDVIRIYVKYGTIPLILLVWTEKSTFLKLMRNVAVSDGFRKIDEKCILLQHRAPDFLTDFIKLMGNTFSTDPAIYVAFLNDLIKLPFSTDFCDILAVGITERRLFLNIPGRITGIFWIKRTNGEILSSTRKIPPIPSKPPKIPIFFPKIVENPRLPTPTRRKNGVSHVNYNY